jgi:hypothetical protein
MEKSKDQDRSKGAMEGDSQHKDGNTSMQGQLGHRDPYPEVSLGAAVVTNFLSRGTKES